MIALLLGVALADCELASIQTDLLVLPGAEITRGVSTAAGWLSTGSVVRLAESCEGGRMAAVISENWHYRHPEQASAPLGATVCLPDEVLHPLGSPLIALSPPPGASPQASTAAATACLAPWSTCSALKDSIAPFTSKVATVCNNWLRAGRGAASPVAFRPVEAARTSVYP